jgi:hypothetical protein
MLDVNDLILELAEEVRFENEGNNNWNEVSTRLGLRYGIVKTPNACKKTYQRINKKQGIEPKSREILEVKPSTFAKFGLENDGTQTSERMLALSESDMKNPTSLMKAHGYNPNEFELLSATNNFWGNEQYQSKIKVKPLKSSKDFTLEDVKQLLSVIKEDKFEHGFKLIELDATEQTYALEIDWADIHIGSLSWDREVGVNNDYKIAFGDVKRVVAKIKKLLETRKIEKIIHCFLGDFLHIDTDGMTTTHGTDVDFDTRPTKMVIVGFKVVQYIINETCCVPMLVKWVGGNHSKLVEFTMFWGLGLLYADVKHIEFDVEPTTRKIFTYGKNLIGLHHGDVISKTEQDTWLQNDYRVEWANCNYAEIHSGHLHQEILFSEKGGITKRTNPTLKKIDKYEYDHAWSSKKAVLG